MADLLIRDVPGEVTAAIDTSARRLGLSCSEYLRRVPAREVPAAGGTVTIEDLSQFAAVLADLADPDVIGRAWW